MPQDPRQAIKKMEEMEESPPKESLGRVRPRTNFNALHTSWTLDPPTSYSDVTWRAKSGGLW